jgi:ubiquinone/menaquinone biosynthesis C-methylase UbiE
MNINQKHTIHAYDKSAEQFTNTIAKLTNYDHTYDYISSMLKENAQVLDLACGPANISSYLLKKKKLSITGYDLSEGMLEIARKAIPEGSFIKHSIIDFHLDKQFDLVLLGFGLPYLNSMQAKRCIQNCYEALKPEGLFYLSFMDGDKEGFESTSFNPKENFYLFYHRTEAISNLLEASGFTIIKSWDLDYREPNGSVTTDSILLCRKTR